MKIEWHCRGCNEKGEQEVDYTKFNPEKDKVLVFLISQVEHKCDNLNLGIKNIP